MQRLIYQDVMNAETSCKDRANLARSWCLLEERKRILKGKGLPKPTDPVVKAPRSRNTMPIFDEQAAA